jgi:hypothetical protein
MGELRSEAGQKIYNDYKLAGGLTGTCKLCTAPHLKTFDHWTIIENRFPYDRIASRHEMIISKRCIKEQEITEEEWAEFRKIKEEYIHKNYDFIMEATYVKKTIPGHFHLHLIVVKN